MVPNIEIKICAGIICAAFLGSLLIICSLGLYEFGGYLSNLIF